jgi:hypothetical protein
MEETDTRIRRPIFLLIIGIISIFSNSVSILINAFLLFGIDANNFLLKIPVTDVITEEGLHGNILFFILEIALHATVIFSVILLLKMQRKGFYIYIGIQAALLILPLLFLGSLGMSYLIMSQVFSLIFCLLFVFLYWMYLPKMK